jgi:hypothetical protein
MMQNLPRIRISGIAQISICLCFMNSAYAATVIPEEAVDNTTEETGGSWDAAGESSAEAWEKTKKASGDTWDATKETSAEVWDDTKAFSSDAWDATREGSANAWEKTKEVSGDTWDATKEGSAEAWDSTKEWLHGSDEESSGTKENLTEETDAGI